MLIDVVSPLLTTLRDATRLHSHFRDDVKLLIEAHPERYLHLLQKVLPEEVRYWPYGISSTLDMIAAADDSLATDARVRDLRRRWDAR
ncbi:hypothetical protein [Allorhodopirellula solitaria]|uniref:Uncharacterized protein n=1 Tax=Allorhodopirellula solitaria TaxID=2527987 RepID=A0A5C5WY58_9BACT|nr:hypothetical protein [Allorhodopirellula solitaria]TWT55538.1 hypothetical protein CA85_48910 [Allorhodopirellula solitaria]